MASILTRRSKDTGGDTEELMAARIERAEALAEHSAAEEVRLAALDPQNPVSHFDQISARANEFRARKRLEVAERRWQQADQFDKRRRRELVEERLRPICRREIELLAQVEALEAEKAEIIAEANEAGVTIGQDWIFIPAVPESAAHESHFRVWERWLSPRL